MLIESNVRDIVTDESNVTSHVCLPVVPNAQLGVLREPLGEGQTVPEAGEYWYRHSPPGVAKHLRNVSSLPQTESLLVRAPPEDWGSEGLQSCPVMQDEMNVIT